MARDVGNHPMLAPVRGPSVDDMTHNTPSTVVGHTGPRFL